jgi:hypothetical protein
VNWLEKGSALPASLGGCADLLHDVRELRLEMQRQTDAIEARENEIRDHIINNVSATDTGAVGQRFVAKVTASSKPAILDWGVFCAWVRKNDRFDCLQKRLSDDAVVTTQNAEQRLLPGLQTVHVKKVSVTKL